MPRRNVYRTHQSHYSIRKHLCGIGSTENRAFRVSIGVRSNKSYVIKYFEPHKIIESKKQETIHSMKVEIEAYETVRHPNISKFQGYCEDGILKIENSGETRISYFVMEDNHGISLFDYIKETTPFSEFQARYYFKQLMNVLQHFHKANFIHRDIKLDNILIDDAYNLRLIDFGLSCKVDSSKVVTGILGTKGFVAPELFSCRPVLGPPTDIFSSGVSLLLMIVACQVFTHQDNINEDSDYLTFLKSNQAFWKKYSRSKKISKNFKDLINQMLDPNPSKRITINEILIHPWMTSESVPSYSEIVKEFERRREIIEKKQKAKEKDTIPRFKEEIFGTEIPSKMKEEDLIPDLFGSFDMEGPLKMISTEGLTIQKKKIFSITKVYE